MTELIMTAILGLLLGIGTRMLVHTLYMETALSEVYVRCSVDALCCLGNLLTMVLALVTGEHHLNPITFTAFTCTGVLVWSLGMDDKEEDI